MVPHGEPGSGPCKMPEMSSVVRSSKHSCVERVSDPSYRAGFVVPYVARSRAVVSSASYAASRAAYIHLVRTGRWEGCRSHESDLLSTRDTVAWGRGDR